MTNTYEQMTDRELADALLAVEGDRLTPPTDYVYPYILNELVFRVGLGEDGDEFEFTSDANETIDAWVTKHATPRADQ